MKKLIGHELIAHTLPDPGQTLEQLEQIVRAAGYTNPVPESGGLLLHYEQWILKRPEASHDSH